MELPEPASDGHIYLTTRQAAQVAGVADCTISSWKAKKLLLPHPASPPRRPLYRMVDVQAAEERAWKRALEAAGTDIQITRRQRRAPSSAPADRKPGPDGHLTFTPGEPGIPV